MKLFRTLFVAGLVQVAALSVAHAQSGLDRIKSAGVLKFGTEGTYAPSPITRHRASWSASTWTSAAPSRSAWA